MSEETKNKLIREDRDVGRTTALVTGSVAVGALVTSSLFRKLRNLKLSAPHQLRRAVDSGVSQMEFMEGTARFYKRDGSGIPIVLLHSVNAAASSFEMKPIFEHLAQSTTRPLYALDWIGFGRSDRPPVHYSPSLFERQLRRFLSEHVHQPADIIALSLSCEYTAEVARSLPYLVNRLVLISPTGLSSGRGGIPGWQRALISTADTIGAFEIFFYRLARPEMLRSFYHRQVFLHADVPEDLVNYARETALVLGAHHAPKYFTQGHLSNHSAVFATYRDLRVPTLLITPASDQGLIQQFDLTEQLRSANPDFIHIERVNAGLLPQWENPQRLMPLLEDFIAVESQ